LDLAKILVLGLGRMGERTLEIFARLVLTMDMLILLNWEICQELTPEVLLWGLVSIVN